MTAMLFVPIMLFSVIILPIFNHNGVTPLFYVNDMAVTLENVIYGFFMTIMLMAVLTLHGNVLPIGGLKEKSMAAFREGISTVLIPEANKPDLYEVDEEVKKAVKFIPVSDLSQVLKHALILPAASAAHKRTMPQATQLIATEQSTAKEPAAVM